MTSSWTRSESKLDYYLERRLVYRPGCGAPSELRLQLRNTAPSAGLPDDVTAAAFRGDRQPGTNRMIVNLYVPRGSTALTLTRDGTIVDDVRQGDEHGGTWVELVVELEPAQLTDLSLRFNEPAGPVGRLAQPLVVPEEFAVVGCGG